MIVTSNTGTVITISRAEYDALMTLVAAADRLAKTKTCPTYIRTADTAVHATNARR